MKRSYEEMNICRGFMNRLSQYHPEIARAIYHVANESSVRQRTDIGIKPGQPDYHLPISRNGYGSLYIEMKRPWGKLSPAQVARIGELTLYGNHVVICYSVEEAVRACVDYMQL